MVPDRPEQPFIYGRPVRDSEFLNRRNELRTIFNRIRQGESTAIVGEPHIGKSSLLIQIDCEDAQEEYLGNLSNHPLFSLMDLHPIESGYEPTHFWEDALEPIKERPGHATTAEKLDQAIESRFQRRSLERLFKHLASRGQRLVLLLDEFDRLIRHPNFQDPAFYALLRSIASRHGSLAIVTACRLSVADLNERGRNLLDTGSPFFNNFTEVRLRPFDSTTASSLFDLAGTTLTERDRLFILHIAGRSPFLLQAMAAALIEAGIEEKHASAAEDFYRRISFHFDDLWQNMEERTQTAAIILCLMELHGRAFGNEYSFGEIERADMFAPELNRLADLGFVERVDNKSKFDWDHLLLWQGARWSVTSQAFVWWIRDVVISETRELTSYQEWLEKKRYKVFLPQEQWDRLTGAIRKLPQATIKTIAGTLFNELLKPR